MSNNWVQDEEHSWHLPCNYDTINLRITSDLDEKKYRAILEILPHRGVPLRQQVLWADDKDTLLKRLDDWMENRDDPTEVIETYLP